MKFNIRGKKVEVTEPIKNYIENKLGKLDKYFENPDNITATVVVKIKGIEQIVEVTIPTKNVILRGEESNKDLYAAIDLVLEKIERQIRKNKTKMNRKINNFNEFNLSFEEEELENNTIVKRKKVEMKPMSEEEAVLQMELLSHSFFVFKNSDTGTIDVLYKRKDGDYGIIETN